MPPFPRSRRIVGDVVPAIPIKVTDEHVIEQSRVSIARKTPIQRGPELEALIDNTGPGDGEIATVLCAISNDGDIWTPIAIEVTAKFLCRVRNHSGVDSDLILSC